MGRIFGVGVGEDLVSRGLDFQNFRGVSSFDSHTRTRQARLAV